MKYLIIILLLPTLLLAQEFTFRQEYDTIPVEIDGWQPFVPWLGGINFSYPSFADIDSDSDPDLFVGNQKGFISHTENIGNSTSADFEFITYTFNEIDLSPLPFGGYAAPKFCDIDDDDDLDLFVGDFAGLVHFWENSGGPSTPVFQLVSDTLSGIDVNGLCKMDFVDLDQDQDYDLVIGDYFGLLWYFENSGTTQTFSFSNISVSLEGIDVDGFACPRLIDIDSDNDFDLFIGNGDGNIWYYENVGTSISYNFEYRTDFYNGIDVGENASPEFADIDGDGDYDLFVGRDDIDNAVYSPGDIYFYENIGTPEVAQWQLITKNYLSLDEGDRAKNTSTDINADLDIDCFIGNRGNTISYLENTGDQQSASFLWITSDYQGIYVNACNPYFSDIDADQDQDLFIGEGQVPFPPYPGLHLYRNTGTPQNAAYGFVTDDLVPGEYNGSIKPVLADIDADGDQDLFIGDIYEHFYFSENIGTPISPRFDDPIEDWQNISARFFDFEDIDNDNDLDLFFITGTDYDRHICMHRNIGTPQSPIFDLQIDTILTGFSYISFFIGLDIEDIDEDGDGDFFLGTSPNGGLLFFRNTTGDTAAVQPRLSLDPAHGIQFSIGPNPANPITWISYNLPYPQMAEIAVYNLLGQKVATLASGLQMPGEQTLIWDAADYASGQYFVRLETESPNAGLGTIRLQSMVERVVVVK